MTSYTMLVFMQPVKQPTENASGFPQHSFCLRINERWINADRVQLRTGMA